MECVTRGGKAKKKYENEETAKEKAELMGKRYKEPFNYYRCKYCGFFHVGRQNGRKNMKPLNIDEYAQGLLMTCISHRKRFGINEQPHVNDCEIKACKTGCPIKKMPKALTKEDLEAIEKEVAFEELSKKKAERLAEIIGAISEVE